MIISFTASNYTWKIQITIIFSFISSKDTSKERDVYIKSENLTVITGSKINNLIETVFDSLLSKNQNNFFGKMRCCEFFWLCKQTISTLS